MFYHSFFMFILGWILWFSIDKQPAALGTFVPDELDTMLANFQMAFDMIKAGYITASWVFIWKAHYIVLSLLAGLASSLALQAIIDQRRRHRLRELMLPKKAPACEQPEHKTEGAGK